MESSVDSRKRQFRDIPRPESETDVLRAVVAMVRERLPASWETSVEVQPFLGDRHFDAIVRLRAPDGQRVRLLVEAKRLLNTRDVPIELERLRDAATGMDAGAEVLSVLAARYLAPATRERIAGAGAGYVDATGNMRIVAERPALFLSDRGADHDPWRGPGRPRGSLDGAAAARVVRALIDFAPPYTVPELTRRAGATTGPTYRVVEFLEQEDLLTRTPYGPISDVRWRPLLMRWSEDYGFAQANTVQTYLEPRGLSRLTERLRDAGELDYVLTGSLAAERFTPYAPARLAMLYVKDVARVAQALGLRQTETGGNVAIATGKYDVVFARTEVIDGLRVAAPAQIAVDLLSGPGRNPSEATALLDWMATNERSWRR
jgi:hypothetical protein